METDAVQIKIEVAQDTIEALEKGLSSKHPELRKATTTITETINTVFLPLAAINAGRKKIEEYFSERFGKEFDEKTKDIPPEHQQEPKHNIARAAINGIADTLDQPSLKNAFLNTLAKSVDNRNDDSLYPAYLSIIQELGTQGLACFVQFVAKYKNTNPYYPPIYFVNKGAIDFALSAVSEDLLEVPKKAMLENWVRLGLITLSAKMETKTPTIQDTGFVTGKHLKKIYHTPTVSLENFEVRLTDFAKDFIATVDDL